MDSDEREVSSYLKSWGRQFVAAREIARRASGKRRFKDEPQWVYPVLARMLEKGVVETDGLGHYRAVHAATDGKRKKRWVSPHLRRILDRSGKDFTEVLDVPDEGGSGS